MKLRTRALGVCLLATLAAAAAIGSGNAAAATSPVVGHVYVNDNTAGTNTIAGFDRHADGTLTPDRRARRSPPAAPAPGSGIGSQGALQLRADGRFLLAVDAGSNQISVLRIRPDGSLDPGRAAPGLVARHPAGQHRRPQNPRLRRQRRQRRQQLHRVPAQPAATCGTCAGSTVRAARRLPARRRAVQLRPAPTWPARGSAPR